MYTWYPIWGRLEESSEQSAYKSKRFIPSQPVSSSVQTLAWIFCALSTDEQFTLIESDFSPYDFYQNAPFFWVAEDPGTDQGDFELHWKAKGSCSMSGNPNAHGNISMDTRQYLLNIAVVFSC